MANNYLEYLEKNKTVKISPHFTLKEICYSDTAIKYNIDNIPNEKIINNAKELCLNVLEKVRIHFNSPLKINCLYRGELVNKKVGGTKLSQHLTGHAADFYVVGHTIQEVFDYIKNNLMFDQLIHEGTWIHVSFNAVRNRKQSLKLVNGEYRNA